MTHYNMNIQDVRNLSVNDAKQLLYWAQAMQGEEEMPKDAVYLGLLLLKTWRSLSPFKK